MDNSTVIIAILAILFIFSFLGVMIYKQWDKKKKIIIAKEQARNLVKNRMQNKVEFTSFEFIQMYSDLKKNNIKLDEVDGSGCYVLLNKSKNKNYVGQSVNVLRRINNHLNGKGNGDVYADLKYGDMFKIIIVKCNVDELNVIEKNLISEYDAFSKGYNRNEGVGKGY